MDKINGCKFCDVANGKIISLNIDKPIFANEDFFSIPSLGSIVEGWMLVVPRIHVPSMRHFYDKISFKDIMRDALFAMREVYGNIVMFEHGSNKEKSITACGTNHAHVHLVSLKDSLYQDISDDNYDWLKCKTRDLLSVVGDNEYLFYSDLDCADDLEEQYGYVHILECETSQYFRKIIARKMKCELCYDYNKYPFIENVLRTKSRLSKTLIA